MKYKILTALIPALILLAAGAYLWVMWTAPNAAAQQQTLKTEFRALELPEDVTVRSVDDNPEWGRVFISGTYQSELAYDELKHFYTEKLQRTGWQLAQETQITDWGRNLGGRQLIFCKRPYTADLKFAGQKAGYGWDYAFSMSWNVNKLCA